MGNAESGNPVRNMDKRTARREYRADFAAAITRYRQRTGHSLPNQSAAVNGGSDIIWDNSGNVKVFVRKRPIFQHELDGSEFDVITCFPNRVVVHDARMHNDMKRQLMNHHEFEFDKVFHEKTSNEVVYQQAARPLVQIAVNGGYSTALVYGQTGSGKTFTMSSIYKQAAQDIFNFLHDQMERFAEPPVVSLSFIEIAGDSVSDLLNGFHPAQLTTANDGSVHPYPVVEPVVTNAEELLAVIQHGLNIRTTAATGVHDSSSRSHAMLRIFINRTDISDAGDVTEGTLTLVDLAGSEHRIDSMYHGKERRKETSHINASLMALKDCIRSRAQQLANAANNDKASANLTANAHIYRRSKLTMALKNSFVLPHARTIVIATVSPASKDTEHSLNTLRHACLMNGQDNVNNEETRFITGGKTTTEQIGEINISSIARRNQLLKKQQGSIDEAKTSNGNTLDNRVAKAANQEVEMTEKMKLKMRRMSENRSFAALSPSIKEIFKKYRPMLGREKRQMRRMRYNHFEDVDAVLQKLADDEAEAKRKLGLHQEEADDNDDDVIEDEAENGFHSSMKDEEIVDEADNDFVETALPTSRSTQKSPHLGHAKKVVQQQSQQQYQDDFEDAPPPLASARSTTSRSAHHHHHHHPSTSSSSPVTTSSSARMPFQQIYDAIYIAKDDVPDRVLQKQLRAMLKLHAYSDMEIQAFMSGLAVTANNNINNNNNINSSSSNNNRLSVSRPVTPSQQRTSSSTTATTTSNNLQHTPVAVKALRPTSSSTQLVRESVSESGMKPSLSMQNIAQQSSITGNHVASNSNSMLVKGTIKRNATPNRRVTPSSTSAAEETSSPVTTQQETHKSLTLAKQKLEEEARVKQQRQEQARLHREEQERLKMEKVLHKKGTSAAVTRKPLMKTAEEEANDTERERHVQEISKLTAMLEEDQQARPEEKLSSAMKFGVKKQLSLHKAAILKLERAKLALQSVASQLNNNTNNNSNNNNSITSMRRIVANPFDETPLPTQKQAPQDTYQDDTPPPAGALAQLKKKTTSTSSRRSIGGGGGVKRGAFEYDPSDFEDPASASASAAAAMEEDVPLPREEFVDRRPNGTRSLAAAQAMERATQQQHQQHQQQHHRQPHSSYQIDGYREDLHPSNMQQQQQRRMGEESTSATTAGGGAEELYYVSETGRPLSKHTAQHVLQQQQLQQQRQQQQSREGSGGGSGGGRGVIGYHIEERSSYDSDTFSRAMHQPVGLRSDHYFPPSSNASSSHARHDINNYASNRNVVTYDEFFQEAREDPRPRPLSGRSASNSRGSSNNMRR